MRIRPGNNIPTRTPQTPFRWMVWFALGLLVVLMLGGSL